MQYQSSVSPAPDWYHSDINLTQIHYEPDITLILIWYQSVGNFSYMGGSVGGSGIEGMWSLEALLELMFSVPKAAEAFRARNVRDIFMGS